MLDGEESRDAAPEPEPAREPEVVPPEAVSEPEVAPGPEAAPAPEVVPESEAPAAPAAVPEPEAPAARAVVREPEAPLVATPSIIDGEDHAVDPLSVSVDRIVLTLSFLGVAAPSGIGISIAWAFGGIATWLYLWLAGVWLVLIGAGAFLGYTWPALHHKHLRYRVDEAGVRIKRGVVWRTIISIPNSRVQHTDVSQGPLERRYNIATLTVHTAGTQGASIHLSGLRHDVALRLGDHLLPTGDRNAL